MKTADKENPNRWDVLVSNRAPGAGGQNRSCSIKWAAKQGNGQPLERCFLLTSTFIEPTWSCSTFVRKAGLQLVLWKLAKNYSPSNDAPALEKQTRNECRLRFGNG